MTMPRLLPRDLKPEMPVVVIGAKEGHVVPKTEWERGYAPREVFSNLAAAQVVYPDLSLDPFQKSRFVGPVVEEHDGKPCSRFDTYEYWNWSMSD